MADPARYAVVEKKGHVRLMEGSRPRLDRRDMLVRVVCASVCGTDVHLVNSEKPFPWNEPRYPFRIGHEWMGRVEELGSDFPIVDAYGNSIRAGDRVVVYPSTWACGQCFCCRILLQPNLCLRPPFGRKLPPDMSAFADWFYVPEGSTVFRVPDDLDSETAVLTEPMAVAVRALERSHIPGVPDRYQGVGPGKSVVVLGSGPIGALIASLAHDSGCAPVIVIGAPAGRLTVCNELGSQLSIDISMTDGGQRKELVSARTLHGLGADVVFEAAGNPKAFVEGIGLCRPGGTFVELGHYTDHGSVAVNPLEICKKDMQILGCWGYGPQQFGESLGILSRNPEKYRRLITHRYPLEHIREALHAASDQRCMKALVEISQ